MPPYSRPPNKSGVTGTPLGDWKPRFGLALSGGGFRASFFHIGVLARLAELDLLRPVEVISTISGGSIIGALYYLHLKNLLETQEDSQITREDYIRIIERIEREFLAGVQHNIRVRIFTHPWANAKMAVLLRYSRSDRLGFLFDKYFYAPVFRENPFVAKAHRTGMVRMTDLHIRPSKREGRDEPFHFAQNVDRRAKVPQILINATTLNTGRQWIFSPTEMGEHLEYTGPAAHADPNALLENLRYEDAPEVRHQHFPLGIAVAASACVPGLFHPQPILGLYPGWDVQLVDGGVHDNQGLTGLAHYRCQSVLVSDGSGLMPDESEPLPFVPDVLARSSAIMMDRNRDHTVETVLSRAPHQPGCVLHIRDGVSRQEVSTQRVKERFLSRVPGVCPEAQKLISRIRTDLDAFNDHEADAIMASGYRIANARLRRANALVRFLRPEGTQPLPQSSPGNYRFQWISKSLARADPSLKIILRAANSRVLKLPSVLAWRVVPLLQWFNHPLEVLARLLGQRWYWLRWGLPSLLLVSGLSVAYASPLSGQLLHVMDEPIPLILNRQLRMGHLLLTLGLLAFVVRFRRLRLLGTKLMFGSCMVSVGWIIAYLYMYICTPLYLWLGKRPSVGK